MAKSGTGGSEVLGKHEWVKRIQNQPPGQTFSRALLQKCGHDFVGYQKTEGARDSFVSGTAE